MNVYEQTSDVRRNLQNLFTILLTVIVAGQVWFAIDPRPEQLTRVVQRADEVFVSAWALLLAAAVVGTFFLARFAVHAALPQRRRGKVSLMFGVSAVAALLAGAITGMLAEGSLIAVALAVGSNWTARKSEAAG